MAATIRKTLLFDVECRHDVNGVSTLYNPTTLIVSVLHFDGSEEVFTYGGTDVNDSHVTLTTIGKYVFAYVPLLPEECLSVRVETIDTVTGEDWPSKSDETTMKVDDDPRHYVDTP